MPKILQATTLCGEVFAPALVLVSFVNCDIIADITHCNMWCDMVPGILHVLADPHPLIGSSHGVSPSFKE